jgi:hypothetical protein
MYFALKLNKTIFSGLCEPEQFPLLSCTVFTLEVCPSVLDTPFTLYTIIFYNFLQYPPPRNINIKTVPNGIGCEGKAWIT